MELVDFCKAILFAHPNTNHFCSGFSFTHCRGLGWVLLWRVEQSPILELHVTLHPEGNQPSPPPQPGCCLYPACPYPVHITPLHLFSHFYEVFLFKILFFCAVLGVKSRALYMSGKWNVQPLSYTGIILLETGFHVTQADLKLTM